jgi:glycosyltransferase involved in cell wall biosynthesis
MRVLHVVATGQRRGAEIFTADLVGALDDAGVEQKVAVLRSGDGLAIDYRAPTIGLGVEGRGLPGMRVGLGPAQRLRRLLRDWDADVVQAHGGEALKYSVLAASRCRARVVYRRIGSSPHWIAQGPRRIAYGRLMRRTARVIAVADAVREETLALFRLPTLQVVTIPNGIDTRRLVATRSRVAVRQALGIPEDADVVLSLGSLTWEKDPLGQIEITAGVLAERPRVWHLIVGDGPLRGQVEAAVDRVRPGGDRILPVGAQADVGDFLAASDLLLFASRSGGMEGMPATVIEAGMAGLPVAGFAVAGVSEVVESGTTGLLARPGDVAQLRAHVVSLLADGRRRHAMSAAARRQCRDRFDIRAVAPQYLDVYRSVKAAA